MIQLLISYTILLLVHHNTNIESFTFASSSSVWGTSNSNSKTSNKKNTNLTNRDTLSSSSSLFQSNNNDDPEQQSSSSSSSLIDPKPYTKKKPKVIPITILSGFLGSGKTTLLSHLLNNAHSKYKIALIVNDVASINIDTKLLRNIQSSSSLKGDIINLSNGCACCSLSDDLLLSLSELITLSDLRQHADDDEEGFDRIIVECSGISDPKSIRTLFQTAYDNGMPLMDRIMLDSMTTVIDASTVLDYIKTDLILNADSSPELFRDNDDWKEGWDIDGTNMPPGLLEALGATSRSSSLEEEEEEEGVSSLLVSQIEIADVVLINKCDLLPPSSSNHQQQQQDNDKLQEIKQVLAALNPNANVLTSEYGKVPLEDIIAEEERSDDSSSSSIADMGIVDDHRELVRAHSSKSINGHSHGHSHTHSQHEKETTVTATATDHMNSHDHSHNHEEETSPTTSNHNHDETKTSHSHSHNHDHNDDDDDCTDPNCTDPSHSHDHNQHSFIHSFVYKARRPFHPIRFYNNFIHAFGSNDKDDTNHDDLLLTKPILRSKGFCWLAYSHEAAYFLSFAGKSLDIQCLGRWWATLPQEHWPIEVTETILQDFHKEESNNSEEVIVGDRRQEIVIIGKSSTLNEAKINQILDDCLLNDDEYEAYKGIILGKTQNDDIENALKEVFDCPKGLIFDS